MEALKVAAFGVMQRLWTLARAGGRAVLGPERFERLIAGSGLRGLKSRTWLSRRAMPDGKGPHQPGRDPGRHFADRAPCSVGRRSG